MKAFIVICFAMSFFYFCAGTILLIYILFVEKDKWTF